jgi:hypothetical protein
MNAVSKLPEQHPPASLASVIIERIRAGVTLEETKEYYKFIRQIQADEAKSAFDADFVQLKLPDIPKNGKIDMGAGRPQRAYARMEDILDKVVPALAEFGFRLRFDIAEETDAAVAVDAILVHRAGHAISTRKKLPIDKGGAKNIVQAYGSTQTYAMRYAVMALLSLKLGDDDDDADVTGNGKRDLSPAKDASEITMGDDVVPAPDDPDRIPAPRPLVLEIKRMEQRPVADKLRTELDALKTVGEVENWKNLATTSYRAWQLRPLWREALQSRVKGKLMELRGAAEMALFEHERDANYTRFYPEEDDEVPIT